jgi:hypothetical protein
MTDGRAKRIADDTQLVFMGRSIQRFYGDDGLEVLLEHKHRRTREAWDARARETGRTDPGYLLCLFSEDAHDYEVVENSPNRLEVIVSRCVHAEVEGYNPSICLERPTTCMSGDRCHFIFRLETGPQPRLQQFSC